MNMMQTAMQLAMIKAGQLKEETGPTGEQKKRRAYRYRDMTVQKAILQSLNEGGGPQFYISGEDSLYQRAGILEWCYNYADACERQELMQKHMQFGPLTLVDAGNCYFYRGLGCDCSPEGKLWYVEGFDAYGGYGILEWCPNENDAKYRLELMQRYPQFSKLAALKYVGGVGMNHLIKEQLDIYGDKDDYKHFPGIDNDDPCELASHALICGHDDA